MERLDNPERNRANIEGRAMTTLDEKTKTLDKLRALLISHPEVVFAYVHGSSVDEGAHRDIDVAVMIRPDGISASESFDYAFQLSVDLTREMGQDVDVQVLNGAPAGFKNSVFRQGKLLFSRDEARRLELIEMNSLEVMDFHGLSLQFLRECAGR